MGFIMRNCRHFTYTSPLISLYYVFIDSRLCYESVVRNLIYAKYINRLQKVQNRFMRYIAYKRHVIDSDYAQLNIRRTKFDILFYSKF